MFFSRVLSKLRLHARQVFIPDGESRYIPVNLNKLIVCLSVTVDPSAGFNRDEVIEFTRSAITIFIPNNRKVVTKRLPFGVPFLIYIFIRNFSLSLSVFITAGTTPARKYFSNERVLICAYFFTLKLKRDRGGTLSSRPDHVVEAM